MKKVLEQFLREAKIQGRLTESMEARMRDDFHRQQEAKEQRLVERNAKDSWREMKHWHGNYKKRRKCNLNSKQNELRKKDKLWRNLMKYKNSLLKILDSN